MVGSVGETLEGDGSFMAGCTRLGEPEPSPARAAGIAAGDRWVTIDGDPIYTWGDVLSKVAATVADGSGEGQEGEVRSIEVVLAREGELIRRVMTPRVVEATDAQGRYLRRPLLGVSRMGSHVEGPTTRVYFPFPEAFSRASRETIAIAGFIVEQIGKLVTGEAAVEKSLGGPVEIVRQASMAAEKGLFTYARLMGMLSISLGIINLLPVPVLDGGQFLFYAIEGIRGRPLSVAIRERAQQAGVLFLVVLMLSVLVFDVHRLFAGGP
jgi:regulator of sigma E protease